MTSLWTHMWVLYTSDWCHIGILVNMKTLLQVIQIGKAIGWVPAVADRKKAYLHLNRRIPDELKFDLNCLLFTHGKLCHACTLKGANQKRKESQESSCPLLTYHVDVCQSSNPNWLYLLSLSLPPSHTHIALPFLSRSIHIFWCGKEKKDIAQF